MLAVLLVGAGGFTGAIMRYLMGLGVHRLLNSYQFPYGTLAVNVVGCILIGILAGLGESRNMFSPELRTFLLVGLLGGFTTFSSFSFETMMLAGGDRLPAALLNLGLNVSLGLLGTWGAYTITQNL